MPGGFGGPAVRRRITDAWGRLGSFTPSAGLAAARRVSGAFPSVGRRADSADPSNLADSSNPADPSAKQLSSSKGKALVAGAGVLALVAIGGVIVAPKVLGGGAPTDPGCKAYAGTALTAYNKAIDDLNAQKSQSVLSADLSTATTELTSAIGQAKATSVKSALTSLLTELNTVKKDVQAGQVPSNTVDALNTASTNADSAC
jgi:hypothetical protein